MQRPTEVRVRLNINYDPLTGIVTRRASGKEITYTVNGYIYFEIDGYGAFCHQWIWFYMTGEWPTDTVDHKNTNRLDNTWENLRPATYGQNACNRGKQSNNSSGYKGVSWSKDKKKWTASISRNKVRTQLGYFSTPEEASAAYNKAALTLHGEFART